MKVISEIQAASLLQSGWTIIPGGFGSCGHPDGLTRAISDRFKGEGMPRDLNLLFASASGDGSGRGVDALAQEGLVAKVIGGFWGLVPSLGRMAREGLIEAHNWPQGVVSQLFRAIAAKKPGVISKVGLNTFVDPDFGGACLGPGTDRSLVQKIVLNGGVTLLYPAININCALLRGTFCDPSGNISMEREVCFSDALAQAMATKNCGGIVIVQVESLVGEYGIDPHDVKIPGVLVDYVTVAKPGEHPQTYGDAHDSTFTRAGQRIPCIEPLCYAERVIAMRALKEIRKLGARFINLGIGIPALVGQVAEELGYLDSMVFSVESGVIGGRPANGLSFGACYRPDAVIEQSALFDFYEGGGLDVACLGFAEVDSFGNVNVSQFDSRLQGAGGFINISQSTKHLLFCGTFTAGGLVVEACADGLRIVREGDINKFVRQVSHLTFSGAYSQQLQQRVMFITERAVFSLKNGVVFLEEIAPGVDLTRDIAPFIGGNFVISADVKSMDRDVF